MAEFIINPFSISFEMIKNSLENYVASKPDSSTWKDFYESGAGQTIIEIAAALGTFYAYQFIIGRREAYLSTAQNYTSLLGLAQTLGYSASRGTNVMVKVTFIPKTTQTLAKWTILGSYTEYDIVLMEEAVLNAGEQVTVNCIIGNYMYESKTVTTSDITQFVFSNSKVTDTVKLELNGNEVPLSSNLKDAINDYYVGTSNVFGAIDVIYLQQGNYKYKTGDTLNLNFIERNSLVSSDISASNFTIDYGDFSTFEILQNAIEKDDIADIKTKAPIQHETAMLIRARHDYSKYLRLANPDLVDANDHDIYPGLIEITYIKSDGTYMTAEEKQKWIDAIEEARPSGVAKAIITDSERISKKLHIRLKKLSNEVIDNTVTANVDEILSNYKNKLEVAVDLEQIEHDIEETPGVKIARISIDQNTWETNHFYNLFDIVTVSKMPNNAYYMIGVTYKSSDVEPSWPKNIGDQVIDNNIIWEKVDEFQGLALQDWQANTYYEKYDYCRPTTDINSIFKCVGIINRVGSTEPNWTEDLTELNQVYDNQIIWEKLDTYSEDVNTWRTNGAYNVGDVIRPIPVTKEITLQTVSNGKAAYGVSNVGTVYTVRNGDEIGYTKVVGVSNAFVVADTEIFSDLGLTVSAGTATGADWYYTGNSQRVGYNGYVDLQGDEGTYVVAEEQVYQDAKFTIKLAVTKENEWYYTGEQEYGVTGLVKEKGEIGTAVPEGTTIYSKYTTEEKVVLEGVDATEFTYESGMSSPIIEIDEEKTVKWNLQCVAYRAKSSSTDDVDWSDTEGEIVIDNNIKWFTTTAPINNITLNWNQYLNLEREIKIE